MQKLNLEFSAGQVMKALWLNLISQKTDEIVDEVNTLPAMRAATEEVALRVDAIDSTIKNRAIEIELEADGDLAVLVGEENTEFQNGYISDNGDVILEFNYE